MLTNGSLCFQGARYLAEPPTLREIFQSNLKNTETKQESSEKQQNEKAKNKGLKRKLDQNGCSEDQQSKSDSHKKTEQSPRDTKFKKAKNVGSFFLCIIMYLISTGSLY